MGLPGWLDSNKGKTRNAEKSWPGRYVRQTVCQELYLKCFLNVNISNALNPLSPQKFVAIRKEIIKVEYQRMHPLLQGEEQLHLEALEQEANEICHQLQESVCRMTQKRESLKEMYRELTEMCHKPDMELLQVRKEGLFSERETLF